MRWSSRAQSLWAKTGPEPEDWLPLVTHLTDSAAVARWVWREWLAPGVRQTLEAALDLHGEGEAFAAWLAGTHDLGKCSRAFAGQLMDDPERSRFADRIVEAGLPLSRLASRLEWYPHSAASAVALERWLMDAFPSAKRKNVQGLASIAGAHHGLPARQSARERSLNDLSAEWVSVQDELLDGITELTGAAGVLERVVRARVKSDHLMLLTGFVIMVDWIASNQDLFDLNVRDVGDTEQAIRRAERAWQRLDLPGPLRTTALPANPADAFRGRFEWPAGRNPWPVQEAVLDLARDMPNGGLLCIEAPMGVGKTEAALMAADVLASATGRGGLFFAAPTMATSDALFRRVGQWAENAGARDSPVSLFLAHSKASLNEDAQSLPRLGMGIASVGLDEPQTYASVVAHEWLLGRKKGLLSAVAVGTVDQVLFLALQAKHLMLRHLGLASKVVVIDEVHSYDAYMSRYLARALHWLGVHGVPVVLLSATLPHEMKAELVAAYRAGLIGRRAQPRDVPDVGVAYPVLTAATREGVRSVVAEASGRKMTVALAGVEDDDATLLDLMGPCAEEGGCLLIVCSTVARAQHAYHLAWSLVGDDARLLHARFVASARVRMEQELTDELGPGARRGRGRPARRIVVATQVVEQSLDLDFDGMITDIAPVDLLLQRCGRVHRHMREDAERPSWGKTPRAWVRGMETRGDAEAPPRFNPAQELIYAPAVLLPTAAALNLQGSGREVHLPSDIPVLVREVYGSAPRLPEGWRSTWAVARGDWEAAREEARQKAKSYLLPLPHSVPHFDDLWQMDLRDVESPGGEARGLAQVRDTDPTVEVLITRSAPGGYTVLEGGADAHVISANFVPPRDLALRIASSSLRLPYRFSRPALFDRAVAELEEATDPAWQESPLLRGQLQLCVDDDGRAVVAGHPLRYDPELGLMEEA